MVRTSGSELENDFWNWKMILFLVESEVELGLPVPGTNIFGKKCFNKSSD
jgi:hypothetical protein